MCTCEDSKGKFAFAFVSVQCERVATIFLKLVLAAQASSKCLVISQPALELQQLFGFHRSAIVSSLGSGLLRNAPCYVD